MNLQTFNLENSSVLNEEELMVLLGGGFAENEVTTYNANTQKRADLPAGDLDILRADVLYLVPREDIEATEKFLNEFSVELHGLIDESNVLTILELD